MTLTPAAPSGHLNLFFRRTYNTLPLYIDICRQGYLLLPDMRSVSCPTLSHGLNKRPEFIHICTYIDLILWWSTWNIMVGNIGLKHNSGK